MPSGRTHSIVNACLIPLWAVPLGFILGWDIAIASAAGMLLGDLLLSPDLDHHVGSQAYKMWGLFRWVWIPYQMALRHRSPFSHCPVIGTALRLVYIGIVPCLAVICLDIDISWIDWRLAVAALSGLEMSNTLHCILDWSG